MHACDSYGTKCIYLASILNKIYLNMKDIYIYARHIYYSKIYNILHITTMEHSESNPFVPKLVIIHICSMMLNIQFL